MSKINYYINFSDESEILQNLTDADLAKYKRELTRDIADAIGEVMNSKAKGFKLELELGE